MADDRVARVAGLGWPSSRAGRGLLGAALLVSLMAWQPGATAAQQGGYAASMAAGQKAYESKDFQRAEQAFVAARPAAATPQQQARVIASLGFVALRQSRLDEAKSLADQAIALNPEDRTARNLVDQLRVASARPRPAPSAKATAPAQPKRSNDAFVERAPAPRYQPPPPSTAPVGKVISVSPVSPQPSTE